MSSSTGYEQFQRIMAEINAKICKEENLKGTYYPFEDLPQFKDLFNNFKK